MFLLMNTIVFFGKTLVLDPIAFHIGSKPVYWYGIIIATGFFLALLYGFSEAKRTGFSQDDLSNAVLIGTPAAIVGARLYYVLFNLGEYKSLSEMVAVWNGGIAIYGGLIAACLSGFIYCKVKKISFLELVDIVCGGFFIGQFVGRWGNFVNSEAYGAETSLPWKMGVMEEGELIYVHPTFLYESLWNLCGFLILLKIRKHKKYNGQLFLYYMLWYGLGRIWIEGLRTDSLYLGQIRISQLASAVCIVIGGGFLIYNKLKGKRD